MRIHKLLLNFLLIRESETKLVSKLFVFEFFQGSSIALFFTAAISIFLDHRPTFDLPKVYVLSALLLWIAGFIYHKLEHSLSTGKLIASIIIFNAALIVAFRLFIRFEDQQWYIYLFLASFYVLYLLNNLEFWGLAAQLFDVRQSKRLFSLVSAGDIPAKMLGYLFAFLFVPIIGTENLLWVAAALSLISLVILPSILKLAHIGRHANAVHHFNTQSIQSISSAITGNNLIRKLAVVSFFSFASFLIVNFVFYGYVKTQFKSDNALAGFFAIFFAVIRAITLLIKIAITNRMVDKIGLRSSLIISPAILLLLTGVGIYFSFEVSSFKATFYLFGMLAVITEVLRSSIQTPVLLATMQSLPVHQRLRGHTIIKGLLDPFSFFAVGVFLWIVTGSHEPDFHILSIVLFGLVVCWMFFALSVDKNYKETLQTALRNRTLNERDISITDKESLEYLMDKLESGSETEAISVLKLLSAHAVDKQEFFGKALAHPSRNVKLFALQIIENQHCLDALPVLMQKISAPEQTEILGNIIHTVSLLDPAYDTSSFLTHEDAGVVHVATILSFLKKDPDQKQKAEDNLRTLLASNDLQQKIKALQIVGEIKEINFSQDVIAALEDEDLNVKKAAWVAAGRLAGPELMKKLMEHFIAAQNDADILDALFNVGPPVLPSIQQFLIEKKCQGSKSRKLMALLVKMGGDGSANILEDCLQHFPENADTIIKSLVQLNVKSKHNHEHFKTIIKESLTSGAHILYKLQFAQHYNTNVAKALELELDGIKNKCLWLFSFLYDAETIKKAQAGFQANTKESVANALELVQLAVPKNLSLLFCTLFEMASVNEKCIQLKRTISAPHLTDLILVKNILFDIDYAFSYWTKACALYSLVDKELLVGKEFIEPFVHSENEVLKDTAIFILSKRQVKQSA